MVIRFRSDARGIVELACTLYENGAQFRRARVCPTCGFLAPASNVEVVDNWRTTGMRGTGSCDYSA